ncbi:MAG: hypothetical protein OEY44_01995, partial [Candidatus Peregrinibacteria bacterium]|nr:hypothetical protein [Candidatus Peregrinibacteria bacterium]
MKKEIITLSKITSLSLGAALLMLGCGKSMESPEMVLQKSREALISIESGDVGASIKVQGASVEDQLGFEAALDIAFDKSDISDVAVDLSLDVKGLMKTDEKTLDGALNMDFIKVGNGYFLKLNTVESSDVGFSQIKPFIDLYVGKWLKLDEAIIPPDLAGLAEMDEEMLAKKTQMEELFVETNLFTVTKEYGVEQLAGNDVYHYGVSPDINAFKTYAVGMARIKGDEMTTQEIESSIAVLNYLENAELYIDRDDYYVRKAVFDFKGASVNGEADLNVSLIIEGDKYDQDVQLKAPT